MIRPVPEFSPAADFSHLPESSPVAEFSAVPRLSHLADFSPVVDRRSTRSADSAPANSNELAPADSHDLAPVDSNDRDSAAFAGPDPAPALAAEAGPDVSAETVVSTDRAHPTETSGLVELDALGEEIAELSAQLNAATHRLLERIAAFDRLFEQCGGGTGFRSPAHWLAWRTGLTAGAAREKVRVARALSGLPRTSAAMARGALSYSKVRALTRIATAANEAELLEVAEHATAAQLERLVRGWRSQDREEARVAERERHLRRRLSLYPDEDGGWRIRGRLDPEVGAVLEKALAAAGEALHGRAARDAHGSRVTAPQRRADALGLLAEAALRGDLSAGNGDDFSAENNDDFSAETDDDFSAENNDHLSMENDAGVNDGRQQDRTEPGRREQDGSRQDKTGWDGAISSRADRFQVVLHLERAPWERATERTTSGRGFGSPGTTILTGSLADGLHVSAETARRIACDAGLVTMVHDAEGRTLDVGRRTRTVPTALRRALAHRDRRCRFPGCENRYCDAHHVRHWSEGGRTRLDNLVLLCRRHHRAVHEEGFRVEMDLPPAGPVSIRFFRPDGRGIPEVPRARAAAPTTTAAASPALATAPGWGWGSAEGFDPGLVLEGRPKGRIPSG